MTLFRCSTTTVIQVFFIILCNDAKILCCYDITVHGDALECLNLSNFTQFLALKCCVSNYIWQKVVKITTSNILNSLFVQRVQLINAECT